MSKKKVTYDSLISGGPKVYPQFSVSWTTGAHLKLVEAACGLEPSTHDSNGEPIIDDAMYEITSSGVVRL